MSRGKFFVIEGSDGSGKGTQFKLLAENLRKDGYIVAEYDFPQYSKESTHFVRRYLNGEYGSADEVDSKAASLFYALDRFEASFNIKKDIEAGKIVLANRFTASNMAHQGQKIADEAARKDYYAWITDMEFATLQTPKPDHNFVLLVPAATAQKLVDQKDTRNYTDKKRDIHEADLGHLERAVKTYEELCELYPTDFSSIRCVDSDETLLSIDEVQSLLRKQVDEHLAIQ